MYVSTAKSFRNKFEYLLLLFHSRHFLTEIDYITFFGFILLRWWPSCFCMIVMAKLIHNNNTVFLHFIILFLSISSLSVSARRIVPFLQNYGKPIFRSNFHNIYDTSNYGLFQLTNGLALTPQMGFVCFSFLFFFSFNSWTNISASFNSIHHEFFFIFFKIK
jgi:hypothetical protein